MCIKIYGYRYDFNVLLYFTQNGIYSNFLCQCKQTYLQGFHFAFLLSRKYLENKLHVKKKRFTVTWKFLTWSAREQSFATQFIWHKRV